MGGEKASGKGSGEGKGQSQTKAEKLRERRSPELAVPSRPDTAWHQGGKNRCLKAAKEIRFFLLRLLFWSNFVFLLLESSGKRQTCLNRVQTSPRRGPHLSLLSLKTLKSNKERCRTQAPRSRTLSDRLRVPSKLARGWTASSGKAVFSWKAVCFYDYSNPGGCASSLAEVQVEKLIPSDN